MRTLLALGVIVALGTAAAHSAEPAKAAAKKYVVPRTESGQPDLRGVWNYGSDTPFVRQYIADIDIRAQTVADAGKAIYTSKLLLGGVLASETDKLFEAKGKIGEKT